MKSFKDLVLCDSRSERVEVHVRASFTEGELTIEGQDLGPVVEEFWGDSDYEYWYRFNKENTGKLLSLIHGERDPEAALLREFSGPDGCRTLQDLCEKSGIRYRFDSYA